MLHLTKMGLLVQVFTMELLMVIYMVFLEQYLFKMVDADTTESFSVSRVKLVNEDTLFPNTFYNTSGDNQWATAANWDSGSVPSSYTDVNPF